MVMRSPRRHIFLVGQSRHLSEHSLGKHAPSPHSGMEALQKYRHKAELSVAHPTSRCFWRAPGFHFQLPLGHIRQVQSQVHHLPTPTPSLLGSHHYPFRHIGLYLQVCLPFLSLIFLQALIPCYYFQNLSPPFPLLFAT